MRIAATGRSIVVIIGGTVLPANPEDIAKSVPTSRPETSEVRRFSKDMRVTTARRAVIMITSGTVGPADRAYTAIPVPALRIAQRSALLLV
jgi:hypothetical protein